MLSEITPIRAGVSVAASDVKPIKPKRKSRDRDASMKKRLGTFQSRIGRAVALTRAMAAAFQDKFAETGTEQIDAMDGMLGLADLLEGIQAEMYDLSCSKTVAGE